ncbi:hypothetical protein [Pseudoteredinibacter isoporae]|uniref:PEP-CTERM sorting domain-containing protein n=1 Tax=Pseudoteredinibacter isoporae TaxID=570281 RepID=A0A7X0JR15_9GAMM|nr:hypothetical protein [Pseudoteredinibacter isoporae]MBB6520723.1 hypothetical protein [Pseudoteredinibacter isoporae]NHO86290.1 hypothetical protein [Pseudoteredinibacter isoporae]NIB25259.1 hypothetical protein [Pseudoteredinibacter isoporae]
MNTLFKGILVLLAAYGGKLSAAPFTYQFQDAVSASSTGIYSASAGQDLVARVVLDNGGTNNINQSWTSTDIVSVAFVVDGVISVTFDPSAPGHDFSFMTDFQSDASGELIAVPTSMGSINFTSQASVTPGTNTSQIGIWFLGGASLAVALSSMSGNLFSNANASASGMASNWQSVSLPAAPRQVPTVPLGALGILGIILAGLASRARSQELPAQAGKFLKQ